LKNLKEYLQIKEAASLLGVSPMTLRNWDNHGKLKSRRNPINGYRLYKRSDLTDLLKMVEEGNGS
jgi:MerR family transcriptional regulator, copper efflux regulator